MSEYFQCGVFRVHAPTHILKEEVLERRQMREAKINALIHHLERLAKRKDSHGKYLSMDYSRPINDDTQLIVVTKGGQYDIFLWDDKYGKRIDTVPSELDVIVAEYDTIIRRCKYSVSLAEKGIPVQYLSPEVKQEYYKENSPDENPVRGSPYNKAKYDEFERE